ncbi:MAG: hypothetical protein ACXADH_06385 [Candidatus Kariarchaeaceae archaeon]|jgi:hypothetical protein
MKVDLSNKSVKIYLVYFLALILFIVPNQTPSAYPYYTPQTEMVTDRIDNLSLDGMSTTMTDQMIVDETNKGDIPSLYVQPSSIFGDILLMHSDPGEVDAVESMLLADHSITARQMDISQYVPELQELLDFPLIFVWTFETIESPVSIGNILADYIDAGGKIIMASYSFSDPDIDIEGRFIDEKYSPFVKNGSADIEREYDRSSTHEIFQNVARFATTIETNPVTLDETAKLVASYYDGVPFVAIKGQVIGMSAYPNPSYMDGDYSILIANMISYLLTPRVLLLYSDNPITAQNVSDLITPYGYKVDTMNVSTATPEMVNISNYKVIISWVYGLRPADNNAWGNLTADYIDGGGSLIMFPYSSFVDPYALGGRFREEGYSPFEYLESADVSTSYSGGSLHPVLNNVRGYDTAGVQPTDIVKTAFPLAYYDNGLIFVALKGSVVGINSYIPLYLQGDIDLLLVNAIDFLFSDVQYDILQPSITGPVNNSMEEGTIGNSLSWTLFDLNPFTYELRVDGVMKGSGSWNDGDTIAISTNGLSLGSHNYWLNTYDQVGNSASDTFDFFVVDTVAPEITNPSDIEIQFDDRSRNITWFLSDNHPTDFFVSRNDTELLTDTWISDQTVTVFLNDLELGTYIYLIKASDSSGNFVTDTVTVVVLPLIVPTLTSPEDMYIVEGDGRSIIWFVEDDNPSTFILELDGQILTNSSWVALSSIVVNLREYTNGYYNFTLTLHDDSGHEVSDTVMLQVFPRNTATTTKPPSSSSPGINISTQFIAVGALIVGGIGFLSILFRRR